MAVENQNHNIRVEIVLAISGGWLLGSMDFYNTIHVLPHVLWNCALKISGFIENYRLGENNSQDIDLSKDLCTNYVKKSCNTIAKGQMSQFENGQKT